MLKYQILVINSKTYIIRYIKVGYKKGKKRGKDQESIKSSTTPGPGYQWEYDNFTITHHKHKPKVSPISAGDHKASINIRARKHNKNKTEIT